MQLLLALAAIVDVALVYGGLRLLGFKPPVGAVVVVVCALYAAFQFYTIRRRQKARNAVNR